MLEVYQPGRIEVETRLLVSKEWLIQNQVEIGYCSVPVGVGGDFCHWWKPKSTNGHLEDDSLMVVIGDAVGHDERANWLAQETLKAFIDHGATINQPQELMRQVNKTLIDRVKNLGEFVTALCGKFNLLTGKLDFARAGHVFPLGLDARGNPVDIPFEEGQPLNILKDPLLHVGSVLIPPGGSLWLVSDGPPEAMGMTANILEVGEQGGQQLSLGETLGIDGLLGIMRSLIGKPLTMQQKCESAMLGVLVYQGIFPQAFRLPQDDNTIFGLQRL